MKYQLHSALLATILVGFWAACGPADPTPSTDRTAGEQAQAVVDEPEPTTQQAEQRADPESAPPDVAAPPEDAITTASGLAYKVLKEGHGKKHPIAGDQVEVLYAGWTTDGKLYGSSYSRGKPSRFPVNAVFPGWSEGLMLMVEGERRRLWVPQELAFAGEPNKPAGMLVIEVELLYIARPPSVPPDVEGPPKDALRTDSGLFTKVLSPGEGTTHPKRKDIVTINYSGWTTDGVLFDSSVNRWQPLTIPVDGNIPGWTEGLQLMVKGESRRLWIPEHLAYQGRPGQPEGMVVFDVELIDFKPAPTVPADVAAIPNDAVKTPSGLATKLLQKGTGEIHPTADDTVTVHYSGWTTDGKLFDSSVVRGSPINFKLDGVIAGWTEGVQLMVVGEKRRLWIPQDLAYGGRPGAPAGMLVFDVELLAIK